MSFYVANVAIIKIKSKLQQDFFFNIEYNKIQDEKFEIFVDGIKNILRWLD